jgi:hypothetical protein
MRIRFTQDRTTKEAVPQTFKKGKSYDLSEASARHWLNRNVAIEAADEPEPEPKPKAKAPTPPATSPTPPAAK